MSFSSPVALEAEKIVLIAPFNLKILPGSMLLQNYREPCIIFIEILCKLGCAKGILASK